MFGRARLGDTGLQSSRSAGNRTFDGEEGAEVEERDTERILATTSYEVTLELEDRKVAPGAQRNDSGLKRGAQWSVLTSRNDKNKKGLFKSASLLFTSSAPDSAPSPKFKMSASPNLKRMMLMNGYPIAYIILWIPGIANRLNESINGSSPVWLRALQAATQFVGLVNAMTYGFSEQRMKATKQWYNGRRGFRASRE